MCVAIVTQKGKTLSSGELYRGWTGNSDGGGIAYIGTDNKVHIETGFLTYNDFDNAYQRIAEKFSETGPMLVHMRVRSAGSMGKDNCHPFPIRRGAMIHNGTMFFPDYVPPKAGEVAPFRKSDTKIFAEALYNILTLEHVKKAEKEILKAIGSHNKLAFLYDGGEYLIVNEKGGMWDNGRWFSNGSCKPFGKAT